ncbi:hypothetical protein NFI96_004723 [Prochilodus magdalenae]|nr:hypothetical protein NFI96_004723 [Prochilodus magdalenae]
MTAQKQHKQPRLIIITGAWLLDPLESGYRVDNTVKMGLYHIQHLDHPNYHSRIATQQTDPTKRGKAPQPLSTHHPGQNCDGGGVPQVPGYDRLQGLEVGLQHQLHHQESLHQLRNFNLSQDLSTTSMKANGAGMKVGISRNFNFITQKRSSFLRLILTLQGPPVHG